MSRRGCVSCSLAGHASDVRCSLVTGNYEPVARLKLARAGLDRHFAPGQGGFGSDAESRDALPAVARARAGGHTARTHDSVVGDTPLDIACARADGLRVLAVATGPHPASELSAPTREPNGGSWPSCSHGELEPQRTSRL